MPPSSSLPSNAQRQIRRFPRWIRRILVLMGIILLVMVFRKVMESRKPKGPRIIYASRYSDEFKYRPAASPVITEYLPGNRIRLRGATPGGVGIRPGDLPKTPQELARDKKKREEQALKDAKRQLGVKERRKVGKANHGVLRGGE